MNRRSFLKTVTATAATVAIPHVVPAAALGRDGRTAPSDRVVFGAVGTGGKGTGNLRAFLADSRVHVVAVCDVDRTHMARAAKYVNDKYGNTDCITSVDFRDVTRHPEIEAICVGTPDHWHVPPAIDAARHGKDSYVEKPLTLTISEGRELVTMVRRYGRVLQTGSQRRSASRNRFACEMVRSGRIGRLKTVHVRLPYNNKKCAPTWTPQPVPKELEYDRWLGPAPWEPYHPQRCHYQFRFVRDYSGGQMTNFGAHYLDLAQWGIGADHTGPVEVEGVGTFPTTGLFTTATKAHCEYTFANGVKLICDMDGGGGVKFVGSEGVVDYNGTSNPASIAKEPIGPNEVHLQAAHGSHQQEFIHCVRTRQNPTADVEIGHRTATLCHLGNIAMLLGRTLRWDPAAERFDDDEEANRMLYRPARRLDLFA